MSSKTQTQSEQQQQSQQHDRSSSPAASSSSAAGSSSSAAAARKRHNSGQPRSQSNSCLRTHVGGGGSTGSLVMSPPGSPLQSGSVDCVLGGHSNGLGNPSAIGPSAQKNGRYGQDSPELQLSFDDLKRMINREGTDAVAQLFSVFRSIRNVGCGFRSPNYQFWINPDTYIEQGLYPVDGHDVKRSITLVKQHIDDESLYCCLSSALEQAILQISEPGRSADADYEEDVDYDDEEERNKNQELNSDTCAAVHAVIVVFETVAYLRVPHTHSLLPRLFRLMLRIPRRGKSMLNDLLANRGIIKEEGKREATKYSKRFGFLLLCVDKIHEFITERLVATNGNPNKDSMVQLATRALGVFAVADQQCPTGPRLGCSTFYNETLNELLEIKDDFPHYKSGEGFSFCRHPYVLTPLAKSDVLRVESMVSMRHELQDTFFRAIFAGVASPYLVLDVRRDHVVRDTLFQLQGRSKKDLRKQLRVRFIGEEGVDEGGVAREFFALLVRQMFSEDHGMFITNTETNLSWFACGPSTTEKDALEEYRLLGCLLGLAIYNSISVDVRFTPTLYRLLLESPISDFSNLQDLEAFDPDLGRGLRSIVEWDSDTCGELADVVDRTFTIDEEYEGSRVTVPLVEDGENKVMTSANRKEFVRLYCERILHVRVANQVNAFKKGFYATASSLPRSSLALFQPEELEELLCGVQELDFVTLEKHTTYDGNIDKDSKCVRWFWNIVHRFDIAEKRRLLFFTTGSDRVPLSGLERMNFVITGHGGEKDRLMTSHTCFNVLMIGDYSSEEIMEDRLRTAIMNSEGFGNP